MSTAHPTASINRHGLAFKLAFFTLTGTVVIFLAAFGYNYIYSRNQILHDAKQNAAIRTLAAVNKIETVLNGVEKVPDYLAHFLGTRQLEISDIKKQIENLLLANPEIFGTAAAFEPYAFDRRSRYFSPYISRDKNRLTTAFLGSASYNYFDMDWYQIPKEMNRAIWSEPYYDEGAGRITMATYSVPFYRNAEQKRLFTGIVTADISLDWLLDTVSKLVPEREGYAFLISRNGVFVSHPNKDYIMRESIFSIAESHNDRNLRNVGRLMIQGGEGFVPLERYFAGKKAWLYYAPLPSMGWSIGLVIPDEILFAGIAKLTHVVIAIGACGFVILFIVIVAISGTITRPLRDLAEKAGEIARGNLDIDVPRAKSTDEVGELSNSFSNMQSALKEYISDLAETTAAKERIESELKIAHTIQMSFLPKKFPPFPEKDAFEIYATLEPAKEVGGDLYDFFLIDDDHLFFSIGDVSGKGVPAALFMAVTKTLVKGIAGRDMAPSDILTAVNTELCIDNDSSMFVTFFCGILNFRTGKLLFSNAGHNPPVFIGATGTARWLDMPDGLILGVMEDAGFETAQIDMKPGDTLLLYTDGITEAMNAEKHVFSDPALLTAVESCRYGSAVSLVEGVIAAVKAFAGNEPPSDDLTLLAIKFKGKSA
ncbi:MAG: SpoIIE family protein phosphatase [Syntrophales bacterium]|nr:SpoIIE family protein phosphatase [Syntrophales bacterium]